MTRRSLLRSSLAFAAATQAHPILGANDRVNLGVVGVGGRGRQHIGFYSDLPNARIASVCDVNQAARERAQALVVDRQGHQPSAYRNMGSLFDDREIDAVSVATPNHWHALTTIWACQAGKDVYVEKPACHNPYEGRKMVEAARRYARIVQVGSQSRSIDHKQRAMAMLAQGAIGEVYMARGLCYRRRYSIGRTPPEPVPAGIDWNLFLGPAPLRPFTKNRFDYNWHWFWDTGNGDIGNQGVHEMDVCRWGLGLEPTARPGDVDSSGGKFLWDDDQETPNTQQASFNYGAKQILFDVRNLNTNQESSIPLGKSLTGNLFYGSDGFMVVHPTGFQVFMGDDHEKTVDEKNTEATVWDPRPHMANFLNAVVHRDRAELNADIAVGAAAAELCHLANAAYRVKRHLSLDAAGAVIGDRQANALLTRDYRAPYIVPHKV